VCRALTEAALDPAHPLVAPRYAAGGGRNPVRAEPAAGALVLATRGDRGLGRVLDSRPDLVRTLDVDGANPDVDVPADLERLAGRAAAQPPGRP
jgi:hypothetical protein